MEGRKPMALVFSIKKMKIFEDDFGRKNPVFPPHQSPSTILPLSFPFSVFHPPHAYRARPTIALSTSSSTGLCL